MRLASYRNLLTLAGFFALCSVLAGCPDKDAPAEKPAAEPERAEPDDEGKAADSKKPASGAPAAAPADDKKPEDDKGGW